jgi:hypothetical protein
MYRGHPICNRILERERIRRDNETLKKKIYSSKTYLDTKAPPKRVHLDTRAKKLQMEEGFVINCFFPYC